MRHRKPHEHPPLCHGRYPWTPEGSHDDDNVCLIPYPSRELHKAWRTCLRCDQTYVCYHDNDFIMGSYYWWSKVDREEWAG